MQSEELIQSLLEQNRNILNRVEQIKNLDNATLTWRENSESWSILECIEHLNLYGEFYLPQIESKLGQAETTSNVEFKSGWLGNYFAKSMLPKAKLNKMKTFKDKNPIHSKLDRKVIDKFIGQQVKLLDLLNQSRSVDLNKVKIQTSISKMINLKLGDTFQFFINHILRHLAQIDRIRKGVSHS